MNQNESDKKIAKVLESIKAGYDNLEKIESELEELRENRATIFSE